jgi:hypothetical protein
MTWKEKFEVIEASVGYEKAFVSANFLMYMSLYYAKDLPTPSLDQYVGSVSSTANGEAFVVGPTTDRAFFDQGKESVEVN